MPPVITSNAIITCAHGGLVRLAPRQAQVVIQGAAVMCEPDLVEAPIVGCAQPASPSTKPCTFVVSTLPGSTSTKLLLAGRPAYVATLAGVTDGLPPSGLLVSDPGQSVVQA